MIDSLRKKMSKLHFIDVKNSMKKLQAHFWPDILVTASYVFFHSLNRMGSSAGEALARSEGWNQWDPLSKMKALIFCTWNFIGNPKKMQISSIFHFHHVTISFWCYVSECLLLYKAFVEVKWISAKRPNGFLWTGTWLYIPNAWNFPSIHGSPWSNIRPSPSSFII